MTPRLAFQIAALCGFLGVALGAFGAHGLRPTLTANGTLEIFQTAVLYQLIHTLAMLVVSRVRPFPAAAWWSFLGGILIFSGSLFLYALSGQKWLGAITPLGGVGFLAGWLLLVLRAPRD